MTEPDVLLAGTPSTTADYLSARVAWASFAAAVDFAVCWRSEE